MSSQEEEPQPAPTGAPHRRDTGDIKPPTRDDGSPIDPNEGAQKKIDDTDA